ncbi:MAG: helix-turn-helix domain-containing protein [Jatrophihabitantaceae bacterium]
MSWSAPDADDRGYLTVDDVSVVLKVAPSTIRYWVARGDGPPAFRFGKHLRFDRRELDDWITAQRRVAS